MLTSGEIADQLGTSRDTIQYAVRKLELAPVGKAGCAFVYAPAHVKRIAAWLKRRK